MEDITRRSFIGAAAACSAVAAVTAAPALADTAEVLDTDVVIVGLGMSGLACAVQAAELGARVIGVEKMPNLMSGGAIGVEGMFGVDSSMQKEAGIELDGLAIIRGELEASQNAANGPAWKNMVNNSGGNVDWLIEQGVEFSQVDDYMGQCEIPDFHWFEGGVAGIGYIPQMTAKAEELGVQILVNTPCTELVKDETGAVTGIICTREDGTTLQINAKGVVLATGGWAQNKELMAMRGIDGERSTYVGAPGTTGDGILMATAAGARNMMHQAATLAGNIVRGFFYRDMFNVYVGGLGTSIFLNSEGERIINEDLGAANFCMALLPVYTYTHVYALLNKAMLNMYYADDPEAYEEAMATAAESPDWFEGETIEEVAEKAGIDAATAAETLASYNEMCAAGLDAEFRKDPNLMIAIEGGPYYIALLSQSMMIGIGGIETNSKFQALDNERKAIPGLYAIGTDGCMLYRNLYTLNIGGTCNANNINSGRTAAKEICAKL